MELINLRNHSLQYHSHQEMEKILTWSALRKFLEKNNKKHLFNYISDIVVTEKSITIYVKKPIVKNELYIMRESLTDDIFSSLQQYYGSHRRMLKIL